MALPVAAIVEGVTALFGALSPHVAKLRNKKALEQKEIEALHAEVLKQTDHVASLTLQVETLSVQVRKLEAANAQLRTIAVTSLMVSAVLVMAVLWLALRH